MNKKRRATKDSVVKLVKLLDVATCNPGDYVANQGLKMAVTSQLKLAAFDDPEHGVVGCSLNTFKKICSQIGEGFDGVDKMRVRLDRAFSKQKKSKRQAGSRRSLQEEKHKLTMERASQDVDLQRLTLVVTDLLALCAELVTLELMDRERYYELEVARILKMLGTRRL